ncbi:DUF58 domain-containing protein [Ostreibacterium oceani]|uniref:DUF58 domain-containing protein n=1 Tax=Ostreibacterium oceani TaxID=2654998 RepID=A0A6N7ERL8_9GAMM|nr:DUF58 domain-containing protein [Ostreibacterium oceani]MPV85132.1 DUF58 domain-containing protein [Ostreibacterium oceani]
MNASFVVKLKQWINQWSGSSPDNKAAQGDAALPQGTTPNSASGVHKLDKHRPFIKRLTTVVPAGERIDLSMRRAYILPTLKGVYFAITVVILFIWSTNYALSLGYAITFLLAILGLAIAVLTVKNLASVSLSAMGDSHYFAGEAAFFYLQLHGVENTGAIAISARRNGLFSAPVCVQAGEQTKLAVPLDDNTRGRKTLTHVRISSDYPIGIFCSWVWLHFDTQIVIYPKPQGGIALTQILRRAGVEAGGLNRDGTEDFMQLSDYQLGDNLRQMVWKKAALGVLQIKRFQGGSGVDCLLDFHDPILADLSLEAKLSQLCQWALDAEKQGVRYGLLLPTQTIATNRGASHQRQVLEALACF